MCKMTVLQERSMKSAKSLMKQCLKCRQQNLCQQHYARLHVEVPSEPIHIIVMDLIGKFKPLAWG